MLLSLKLAFRYLRMRRKTLARFTTLAAVVGIAAGVASLIVANALAKGFADEMRDKILASTPHIAVSLKDGNEIFDWKEISEKIKRIDAVENVSAAAYSNSIIVGESAVSYATLVAKDGQSNETDNRITVALGEKLAAKIGAQAGSEIELLTLRNQSEPSRSVVRVTDTFTTGIYDYDSTWMYISGNDFAKLNARNDFTPTILSVAVKDIYQTDDAAEKIKAALDDNFQILDWQTANQPLFAALSLERKVSLAIIFLIIFIAALNITTTLSLLVNERRFDIAVLRTCGAKSKTLVSIFLFEGLLIGAVGVLSGVTGGVLICAAGNYFRLINLTEEVYAISYIPFHITVANIFYIVIAALLICLAATIYPALKASRVKPLENLRHG